MPARENLFPEQSRRRYARFGFDGVADKPIFVYGVEQVARLLVLENVEKALLGARKRGRDSILEALPLLAWRAAWHVAAEQNVQHPTQPPQHLDPLCIDLGKEEAG